MSDGEEDASKSECAELIHFKLFDDQCDIYYNRENTSACSVHVNRIPISNLKFIRNRTTPLKRNYHTANVKKRKGPIGKTREKAKPPRPRGGKFEGISVRVYVNFMRMCAYILNETIRGRTWSLQPLNLILHMDQTQ